MPERRTFMQAIGTGLGSAALIGTAAGDTTMVNTKIETEDMDGENSYELECSRMMCKEGHIDDVKIVVNGGTVENISIGSAVMGGEEMDDGMTNQIEDFFTETIGGIFDIVEGDADPVDTVSTVSNVLSVIAPLFI